MNTQHGQNIFHSAVDVLSGNACFFLPKQNLMCCSEWKHTVEDTIGQCGQKKLLDIHITFPFCKTTINISVTGLFYLFI